jgi:ribose/xylose/arabinose/galactoside ABC-type transport system permease subunit
MLSIRGLAFVITAGVSTGLTAGIAPAIVTLGQGRIAGIPVPAILMVVLFLVFALLMTQSVWGLRIAALGSSESATRLAGVKPAGIVFSTFMVAGALSALAGLLLVGRLTSAAPETATGIEFDILTAVVLGGASIYGGRASVLRTLLGAIFDGMLLLKVPSFWQMMANGLALVAALALNQLGSKARS